MNPPAGIAAAAAAMIEGSQDDAPPSPPPAPPSHTPPPAPAPAGAKPPEPGPGQPTPLDKATSAIRDVLDGKKPPGKKPAAPQGSEDDQEMEKTIRANPRAWKAFEGHKKANAEKVKALELKIKELESKPAPTARDDARVAQMEKELEELRGTAKTYQQRLAERDYRESEDFKRDFVTKWQSSYKTAIADIATMQVLDEDGEPGRNATNNDFELLRTTAPSARRTLAKEMFGEEAPEVLAHIRELERIEAEGNAAVADASKNFEKTKSEQDRKRQEESKRFGDLQSNAQREIETKYPEYFSPEHYKDSPDEAKILSDGYDWIDQMATSTEEIAPEERAAVVAAVRARSAATPLLIHQNKALKAEVETLKAELAKFRGSDPGSGSGRAPAPTGTEEVGGIAAMAAKFDE